MTSRPRVSLADQNSKALGKRHIVRRHRLGAVTPAGKRARQRNRRALMQKLRKALLESVVCYQQALEVSHANETRDQLATRVAGLVAGVLGRTLKDGPRASEPLEEIVKNLGTKLGPKLGTRKRAQLEPATHLKQTAGVPPVSCTEADSVAIRAPLSETLVEIASHTPVTYTQAQVLQSAPSLQQDADGYLTASTAGELRAFHPEVVLVAPQIPPNTGTVARLCAAFSARLHLIEPLGFELSEKTVRRAGLDYWEHVEISLHKNFEAFENLHASRRFVFIETGGTKTPSTFAFKPGDLLIFGSETKGIPKEVMTKICAQERGQILTIPMFNRGVRSINLANAVSIVLYQAVSYIHSQYSENHTSDESHTNGEGQSL